MLPAKESSMHRLINRGDGCMGSILLNVQDQGREGLAMINMMEDSGRSVFFLKNKKDKRTGVIFRLKTLKVESWNLEAMLV